MMHYLSDVVTLELDPSSCNGCRRCVEVCPRAVLAMRERRVHIINRDDCIECGACSMNCESGAITVRPGVGCAAGIIAGWFRGGEPGCGCGPNGST